MSDDYSPVEPKYRCKEVLTIPGSFFLCDEMRGHDGDHKNRGIGTAHTFSEGGEFEDRGWIISWDNRPFKPSPSGPEGAK
jgi:hypothetical protein